MVGDCSAIGILKQVCVIHFTDPAAVCETLHIYCNLIFLLGEMVIEYAGELIRSTLTDKRERYYDGRGIGCYMFKIDENHVVDATMRGNAARFINHACEVRV